MKHWKKLTALALALALILALGACGPAPSGDETGAEAAVTNDADSSADGNADSNTDGNADADRNADTDKTAPDAEAGTDKDTDLPSDDPVEIRLAALKGPTAMGLVKLMVDVENSGQTAHENYTFSLAASPDEVTPLLIKGDLDAACIPANLAAVLSSRTDGEIVCLGVNTLGVLYIVEKGNAVISIPDLAGKTIAAAGKGSTPEYALRYLLGQYGLDPDRDVTIDWKSEHSECVAALASGAVTLALLPQPFVTVAQGTVDDLRLALDLNEEWDALRNGSSLITGVVAARRSFVEAHPDAVSRFLADYAGSVAWVNGHTEDAADLIGSYDIVATPVAEKALPYCNIVCVTGKEMAEILPGYLKVLYDANPDAVGGVLPPESFYYGA